MNDRLRIAHSPCPNDTFVFHAWTEGLLPARRADGHASPTSTSPTRLAERGELDVLKISYAALPLRPGQATRCCPAAARWATAAGRWC